MKLTTVISGSPHAVTVAKTATVKELISKVLTTTHHVGHVNWEARDVNGLPLDPNATLKRANVVDGQTLFINPKAGVGGSTTTNRRAA